MEKEKKLLYYIEKKVKVNVGVSLGSYIGKIEDFDDTFVVLNCGDGVTHLVNIRHITTITEVDEKEQCDEEIDDVDDIGFNDTYIWLEDNISKLKDIIAKREEDSDKTPDFIKE